MDSGATVPATFVPTPAELAAFGGAVPAQCAGQRVPLELLSGCLCQLSFPPFDDGTGHRVVRAGASCGPTFYGRDLQGSLSGSILPSKPRVTPGEEVTLNVTLTNLTAENLPVVFGSTVQDWGAQGTRPFLVVRDATGTDVGHAGTCFNGRSASAGDFLVVIAPRGEAVYPLSWKAATIVGRAAGKKCNVTSVPLPPGKYTLEWRLDIDPTQTVAIATSELHGTLEVAP